MYLGPRQLLVQSIGEIVLKCHIFFFDGRNEQATQGWIRQVSIKWCVLSTPTQTTESRIKTIYPLGLNNTSKKNSLLRISMNIIIIISSEKLQQNTNKSVEEKKERDVLYDLYGYDLTLKLVHAPTTYESTLLIVWYCCHQIKRNSRVLKWNISKI